MDILIKGMKMPKSCEECWMSYEGDSDNCPVVNESVVEYMIEEKRHPKCPLIPVPEHGDLIDKQKLIKELEKAWNVDDDQDFCNKSVWRIIEREAEVVLERTT